MQYILQTKWTVSKGRDTYNYNICSLYVNGKKFTSCNGGGYDMEGTVLADWITDSFQQELKRIAHRAYYVRENGVTTTQRNLDALYGMSYNTDNNTVTLEGGCGWDSIRKIAHAFGMLITTPLQITNSNNRLHVADYQAERNN